MDRQRWKGWGVAIEIVVGARTRVTAERELRAPSVVATMLFFSALKVALKVAGFGRTWRWIRRRTEHVPIRSDVNLEAVAKAEYKVAMAAALYPGRALCLERSLTLYWYLRRQGVSVTYRMGVQMYPFMAHAWVEYRRQVINDVAEHVKLFLPIEGVTS
jgi:hypothetical protein